MSISVKTEFESLALGREADYYVCSAVTVPPHVANVVKGAASSRSTPLRYESGVITFRLWNVNALTDLG